MEPSETGPAGDVLRAVRLAEWSAVVVLFLTLIGLGTQGVRLHDSVRNARMEVSENVGAMIRLDAGDELDAAWIEAGRPRDVASLRARNRAISEQLARAWDLGELLVAGALALGGLAVVLAALLVRNGTRNHRLREEILAARLLQLEADRQRELAEESNARLDAFAMTVAHDLRAPLRSMIARAELYKRGDEQGAVLIDTVIRDGHRLAQTLQDLLGAARLRGPAALALVPLEGPLRTAMERVEGVLAEGGATVDIQPLPAVRGHRVGLATVFQNLLVNAVTYRSEERPLVIRIAQEPDPEAIVVVVSDNGTGVAPERRHRLFELFERGVEEGGPPGHGVGLSICRAVLIRFSASIQLEAGDPGLRVVLRFPLPSGQPD